MVKQTWKGLWLLQKSTIREIGIATSHLSFVAFYSYLVSWLAMIWACASSTIREIGIICVCSDHGQPRYQIWIKCVKSQMTSCVHKMCKRTYGQTNMKRAITLAKFNHPWNRYNMRMLISWPIRYQIWIKCGWLICARVIALFMFVWPYIRSHILCIQLVICLLSRFIHIWYLGWPWSEHAHISQTNMKRAITLAKFNHPWNRYNMRMLISWPIKIPNMNKMQQKTNY
jgi:uncharacterized protein (DUF3820 family)